MEFLIVSLGVLAALIVTAAVMDLKARRSRRRLSVDQREVHDARRLNQSRGNLYSHGNDSGFVGPGQ